MGKSDWWTTITEGNQSGDRACSISFDRAFLSIFFTLKWQEIVAMNKVNFQKVKMNRNLGYMEKMWLQVIQMKKDMVILRAIVTTVI